MYTYEPGINIKRICAMVISVSFVLAVVLPFAAAI